MLSALVAAAGCYDEGYGTGVSYGGGFAYGSPDLVYISPDVQVVSNYDYPVFYTDNSYWRYNDGYWYRSPYFDRGWAVTYDVPFPIRRIDRPYAYAHYRGPDYYGRGYYNQPYNRGYYNQQYRGNFQPGFRAPLRDQRNYSQPPAVRDQRTFNPSYRAPMRDQRTFQRPQTQQPMMQTQRPQMQRPQMQAQRPMMQTQRPQMQQPQARPAAPPARSSSPDRREHR
ncbi:MAG: hypothetical protein JWO36_5482 [Myxococcales bacterium]|nr:hypothetical protein [Myxococcales bacterium]